MLEEGHTLPMARFYATFPSVSMHFAGCYDLGRFWMWPFRTFKTCILIVKLRQKYSNFVYFGNYLRILFSIGTSAKCRSYTVMLLEADTFFFKTNAIFSLNMLSSFILCCFCFPKLSSMVCRNYKGKRAFRKIDIIYVRHIVSSIVQKRNSVEFSNSSCKLAMLSKVSYQKSRIASPHIIRIFKK